MTRLARISTVLGACVAVPLPVRAQVPDSVRRLSAAETGCDLLRATGDSVYEADAVDRPVRAPYLRVADLPYHMREVVTGRTMLRFVVEPNGWVDRCSIALVEESSAEWTTAVLKELRGARYEPARKGNRKVRQVVYQVFLFRSDGRQDVSQ